MTRYQILARLQLADIVDHPMAFDEFCLYMRKHSLNKLAVARAWQFFKAGFGAGQECRTIAASPGPIE